VVDNNRFAVLVRCIAPGQCPATLRIGEEGDCEYVRCEEEIHSHGDLLTHRALVHSDTARVTVYWTEKAVARG
jgi:hypothetical protein